MEKVLQSLDESFGALCRDQDTVERELSFRYTITIVHRIIERVSKQTQCTPVLRVHVAVVDLWLTSLVGPCFTVTYTLETFSWQVIFILQIHKMTVIVFSYVYKYINI